MCFGGGDGGASKIAKQQRNDELARQARIKSGMSDIDSVFNGSTVGVNPATEYDPSQKYYNADGSAFDPSAGSIPGGFGGLFGDVAGALGGFPSDPNELIKSGKLFTGTQQTGGFGDDFYAKAGQAYLDYANPQIDRQSKDARDQLIYALARNDNLDSSGAIKKNSDLDAEVAQRRADVASQALTQENTLRSNVENTRSNLVSELNATGDDQAAASAATRAATNLSQPVGYTPLGQMFYDFTNGLSALGSNAGNGYGGFIGGGGRTLFGSSPSSSRVVG